MSDVLSKLRAALGERVRTDSAALAAHRRDTWPHSGLREFAGEILPDPLAVVFAQSTDDVSRALAVCRATQTPVIPFGGGSGVCGGVLASRGAVVLSTRGLDGLVSLDSQSLLATFRAGTLGGEAEKRVQQDGLTIGHWPQSIDISTVGGWIATRASGQFSSAYGSIEEIALALEVVLPDGTVLRTRETPRAAAGPDLRQLFMGSEGTLGVVTEVTFSLRALPEARALAAYDFESFEAGLEAIRRFVRIGWRPPVVRLYDERESRRLFPEHCPEGRHALLLVHEGPTAAVAAERAAVAVLCKEGGAAELDPATVEHWLSHRNQVPSFRELNERGLVVDTLEVAATWDKVGALYERVCAALREKPEVILASAHSSHSYRSGTNLYFTFAARVEERAAMPAVYEAAWDRAMRATLAAGGGIAHHHGIGRVRRSWLRGEIGAPGIAVLRAVKRALDPDGLMNPGALLPDEPAAAR